MISAGLFRVLLSAVKELNRLDAPADNKLRDFFQRNKQLGRRDRHVISETVFDIFRNRRLYHHWISTLGGPVERGQILASLVHRKQLQDLAAHVKPLQLSEIDQAWIINLQASLQDSATSMAASNRLRPEVALSVPDWAWASLVAQYGESDAARIAAAALQPAPIDLRVNTLKAQREQVQAALAAQGIDTQPIAWLGNGLRVSGKPAVDQTNAFEQGWFEVQDAGSQWLSECVDARRGQTVIDFCAGAGGKTLALAAQMKNSGQIYAVDVAAFRLNRLRPRLARSGATNVQPFLIDSEHDPKLGRFKRKADRVLVDAPCSGSGTWRRNPDLKWRQQAQGILPLQDQQVSILTEASKLVRKGGRLIYSTCSLFAAENQAVAERFMNSPEGASFKWLEGSLRSPRGQVAEYEEAEQNGAGESLRHNSLPNEAATESANRPAMLQLKPHEVDADGFFVALFERC